jgi:hypothetical protein
MAHFYVAGHELGETRNAHLVIVEPFEQDTALTEAMQIAAFSTVQHNERNSIVESQSLLMTATMLRRLGAGVLASHGHTYDDVTEYMKMNSDERKRFAAMAKLVNSSHRARPVAY